MIEVRNLLVVLGDFHLHIDRLVVGRGEYMVLMGPSGIGKTVFLETLLGFHTLVHGRIIIDGRDVTGLPPEKRGIAYIPQDYGLFPHMTVAENISFPLRVRGVRGFEGRVAEIAGKLGIKNIMDRYPGSLSGGEKQRVAIARALIIEPKLILLDEPFSNIDPEARWSIRRELQRMHREIGFTAIHATHDIADAVLLGDRVGYMGRDGRLETYSVEGFLKSPHAEPYIREASAILERTG